MLPPSCACATEQIALPMEPIDRVVFAGSADITCCGGLQIGGKPRIKKSIIGGSRSVRARPARRAYHHIVGTGMLQPYLAAQQGGQYQRYLNVGCHNSGIARISHHQCVAFCRKLQQVCPHWGKLHWQPEIIGEQGSQFGVQYAPR